MAFFSLFLTLVGILLVKHLVFWRPIDVSHLFLNGYQAVGHRGSPQEAPENTLPSYAKAVQAGLKAVEMDVLATKDGKVVCSHNHDLERETDGLGYIDEMTYRELAAVDAGVKFEEYSPCKMPLLEEVLDTLEEDVVLDIEIKARWAFDFRTARYVAGIIRRRNLYHRVIVSSFHPLVIGTIKWIDGRIPTGYIWTDHTLPKILFKPRFINLVHPDVVKPEVHLVDANLVRYAHRKRLSLSIWTVNNRPAIQWLFRLGVDGVVSDFPQLMLQVVQKQGGSHAST